VSFDDVIFVWEHTEVTDPDAVRWSLESIERKCDTLRNSEYFKKAYGDFVLVEKSDLIVDGTPNGRVSELLRSLPV
jgi:hypothetical protein